MNILEQLEAEWLSENPHARADNYQPPAAIAAKETSMSTDSVNAPLSPADLAEAAAIAEAEKAFNPHAPGEVWRARVRATEARMRAEGIPAAPENSILGAPAMRLDTPTGPDPKAVAILREFRAAVNPITGKHYLNEGTARSQAMREMLFHAQCQLEAGRPLDMDLVRQAREGIEADKAEAAKLKAKADAEQLASFRERYGQ